MLNQIRNKH